MASRPTVQGQDESRRCFLQGCWRLGVGFLDEGQGLLRVQSSCEVRPGSSSGFPSLHHQTFRRLLLDVMACPLAAPGLKHSGGGQPPSFPWHARPGTHEIQDLNSNLGFSKVFCDPCPGHDTIRRPGQEMKVYVDK